MKILGLDIGGTGIKGAIVDIETGVIVAERYRLKTPSPPTPKAMVQTAAAVIVHFEWQGPVGVGFPAVVKEGVVHSASNIDKDWIGQNAADLIANETGCPVFVANDADVAALGEVRFGGGKDFRGLLAMVTLGTGIGTGLVYNGQLVPNSELGHIRLKNGKKAEEYAAESAKKRDDINSKDWGKRINLYLNELEFLIRPDLFIIGGGGVKKFEKFSSQIETDTPVVAAKLGNMAGIIGAALLVQQ